MTDTTTALHLFYRPEMVVNSLDSYSPSAGKPQHVVEALLVDKRFPLPIQLHAFEAATRDDLKLVHAPDYVEDIFALKTNNGFSNRDPRVPPSTLFTVGSLVSAVLARAELKGSVCSPTSGFHHAHFDAAEGYCTFNGLMVAAAKYLLKRPDAKVGILDCDVHYGNGTVDILKRVSFLQPRVLHHTAGQHFSPSFREQTSKFFEWLTQATHELVHECDVVIYQAGGDMAWPDPLGGFLMPNHMKERDEHVFSTLGERVVWNLAGGYQSLPKIVDIHKTTAYASATGL